MDIEQAKRVLAEHYEKTLRRQNAFQSPGVVKDYLSACFAGLEYELFVVLYLDSQHRLIEAVEMFRGTITQTSVYPREIVKEALSRNASAVILAHNHPSGVTEPSRADDSLTNTLKATLSLIDVHVLDHFIVAGPNVLSMVERGLI